MGIRFLCPNGHKLNVKTDLAGKRAICPDCGAKLVVPAAGTAPSESSLQNLSVIGRATAAPGPPHNTAATDPSVAPASQTIVWYVHSESGDQLGPLERDELATWIVDGRVTAETYLWRVGWPDWRTASNAAHELPAPLPPTAILTAPIAAAAPTDSLPALPTTPHGFGTQSSDSSALSPEPRTLNPSPATLEDLAALPHASIHRPRQQTPLIVTILLIFTIVVLVGVLVWVIRRNGSSDSPTPQAVRIPIAEPGERS
jgi:hypothetical protein